MTTQQEAKELLKKHGTVAAAARAAGLPRMTFVGRLKGSVPKNTLGRRDSRVAASDVAASNSAEKRAWKAFSIKVETRVNAKKPTVTLRARFYELKRGYAYPLEGLVNEWRVSKDALKRHAQDAECFRYVDADGHDDWVACVLHPETASEYPIKQR